VLNYVGMTKYYRYVDYLSKQSYFQELMYYLNPKSKAG